MEIKTLHLTCRFQHIETCLLVAFVLAIGIETGHAQTAMQGAAQGRPSPARITEWQNEVSAGLHLLQELFSNVDPKSKIIILDNHDWGHPSAKLSFAIFVCEPDAPPTEEQERDLLNRYKLHCSGPKMFADFLMTGSQLGPVPGHIFIGRPDLEKRWSDLSATLQAHPEWSKAQKEEAMRRGGVKYGEDSHDQVISLINGSVKKLEPFFGKLIIDSIDYEAPFRPPSSKELRRPGWNVEAHPTGQDRKKPWTTYTLLFSAFDGAFEGEFESIAVHPPR